jgi:hypothetical protein
MNIMLGVVVFFILVSLINYAFFHASILGVGADIMFIISMISGIYVVLFYSNIQNK